MTKWQALKTEIKRWSQKEEEKEEKRGQIILPFIRNFQILAHLAHFSTKTLLTLMKIKNKNYIGMLAWLDKQVLKIKVF